MVDRENELCTACRKKREGVLPQWWSLVEYYGMKGIFCYTCFEKVRHKNGKPVHPIAYRNALRKMPDGSAPIKAHSKTEYKRLVSQGANVLPPTPIDSGEEEYERRAKELYPDGVPMEAYKKEPMRHGLYQDYMNYMTFANQLGTILEKK